MLAKNKSRRITIDGTISRYVIGCRWKQGGQFDFNITVQSEQHNGSKLLAKGLVTRNFWLDFPNPDSNPGIYPVITPRHIEAFVRRALIHGWDFTTTKPDHVLGLTNQETFELG